jgi:hypothetical protein
MMTIRNTNIDTSTRDSVNVGGHEVRATWDANGAHINLDDLRAIREAGDANWSDEEIADLAYHCEVRLDEAYSKAYEIAIPEGDGWHVLEGIRVADDEAANAYAEQHYPNHEWYVLDADGNNING